MKNQGFSVGNLNIQGFYSKLDQIKTLLSHSNIDILGLCETFLTNHHDTFEIEIRDYNCVRRDRITGKKGGIVVYVKNGINYIHCKEIEDDNIESIWIEVCFKNQKRILFGFIYRPPSENVMWIEYFEKQLFKASNFSQNVVLLGDFNFNLFKPNLHSRWNNLIHAFDLKQQVEKATRVSKNTATLIDHIYTSNNINIQQIYVPEHL